MRTLPEKIAQLILFEFIYLLRLRSNVRRFETYFQYLDIRDNAEIHSRSLHSQNMTV